MNTRRVFTSLAMALLLLPGSFGGQALAQDGGDGPAAGNQVLYIPMASKGFTTALALATQQTVNMPFFDHTESSGVGALTDQQWTESGILWFGVNQQGPMSRNYADVRFAYSAVGLHMRATPIDYYLWYPDDPPMNIDLTQWDSISIQVDTNFDRSGQPKSSAYQFLTAAAIWVNPGKPGQYRREARGTGSGWDQNWSTSWSDFYGMTWSTNPGPNNNGGELDYGGDVQMTIPWSAFGLSAPPAPGVRWALSVSMYDRDGPNSGDVMPRSDWPEFSDPANPSTWGVLNFGRPNGGGDTGTERGRVTIRNATRTDTTVQDAWVGGGGNCSGGHNGGGDTNHGQDTSLYVASQVLSADFPCFSKSYLKFDLGAVPAGVEVISSTLKLMQWGGAGAVPEVPVAAQGSYMQVFTLNGDWSENTVTWNNGPQALENVTGSWMMPRSAGADPVTGDPTYWNVTRLVQDALKHGKPLNVVVYSADTGFHSSKYLGSSQVLDQYANLRPSLTVIWGTP